MKRCRHIALALVLLVGTNVAGGAKTAGGAATEPVTLKVWWVGGPEHEKWMPQTIESFNKSSVRPLAHPPPLP